MIKKPDYLAPMEIEKRSFELITEELHGRVFQKEEEPIVKRVIHTTADFEYADNLFFGKDAIRKGIEALQAGMDVVTDTTMAFSGINKKVLHSFGGTVHCYIAEEDVRQKAREKGITRSMVAMEKAAENPDIQIYVVGNAPTALFQIYEMIRSGKIAPALVIGVPVGFVNVVEAKELFLSSEIPCIIAKGRKGGSNVAAAIVNGLLYLAGDGRRD